jgi:glycosyltransferase involved in cell wall biosynthesis
VAVCPVVPYPPVGGGHKRTLRLLEALESAGGHPHLIVLDGSQPDGVRVLRERGWSVDVVPEPSGGLRSRLRQQLRRLPSPYVEEVARRLEGLVEEGCAFVQAEHTQSAYYAERLGDTPWILSLHNVDSHMMRSVARAERPLTKEWLRAQNRWRALRAVERRAAPRASSVLCVSEEDRRLLEPLTDKAVVVPNGVDDEFFELPPDLPDAERVLFFGRFDYLPNAQGIERFLHEGWPALAAARPSARLVLVGGGMGAALRRLAEASPRVEALGFVDDLVAELSAARVVVVPIWSGGGTRLKVLESLAAARPVIGTALGVEGVGFEAGVHGLVSESPAAIAADVAGLLADERRSRELAANGRALAESFRWRIVTRPAEDVYRRMLGR